MISEELKYPCLDAVKSVLAKIGVDPESRDLECQDYEYTTCDMAELEKYIELYPKESTDKFEKRVLGCYIIEGLNDYVSQNESTHPLLDQALVYLHADYHIHQSEIAYRLDIDGRTEEEWWPIAMYLIDWQKRNRFSAENSDAR